MAVIRSISSKMILTFHRAFDVTPDPIGALESIIKLGELLIYIVIIVFFLFVPYL